MIELEIRVEGAFDTLAISGFSCSYPLSGDLTRSACVCWCMVKWSHNLLCSRAVLSLPARLLPSKLEQ